MKKLLIFFLCAILTISFTSCGSKNAEASYNIAKTTAETQPYMVYVPKEENIVKDSEANITFVNNMVMVLFDSTATDEDKIEIINSVNGKVVYTVPSINQYQIEVDQMSLADLNKTIEKLESNEKVLFAHFDEVYDDTLDTYIPDDPYYGDVDEEDITDGDIDGSNWWAELIDLYGAWEYDHYFSKIKIGILDTGFDSDHEDLRLTFPEGFEDQNRQEDHGTHVAGIIGAEHNGIGISGIVKRAELICVDCKSSLFQTNWNTDSMIYIGLTKLVESGSKVINLSMGCDSEVNDSYGVLYSRAKRASGYMAALLENHDFIVVQSAGNNNRDARQNNFFASVTEKSCVTYGEGRASVEGILDRIIIVGNITTQHNKSDVYFKNSTSNYGNQVDISAPGGTLSVDENGETYVEADRGVYSTAKNNGYKAMSGTSMAAPMVSGVCALVWSTSDNFTGAEVANIVISTSQGRILQDKTNAEYGLLNAEAAVRKAVSIIDKTEERLEKEEAASTALEYDIVRLDKSALDEDGNSTENYYYDYVQIVGETEGIKKLNELFYNKAEKFLSEVSGETIASYGPGNSGYSTAFVKVTVNNGDIFGITISADSYTGGNKNYIRFAHYYYDVHTGNEATIDQLTGIDRAKLLEIFKEKALNGLYEKLGDLLDPSVDYLIESKELDDYNFKINDNEVFLFFDAYSVTNGASGEILIPTGLYILGTDKE